MAITVYGPRVVSDTAPSPDRAIFVSTNTPPSAAGKNGDIWLRYM
jgi:hypothetical protein